MSRRYWRTIFAAGGLALLAGLANAEPIGDDTGSETRTSQAQSEPSDHAQPAADAAVKRGLASVARSLESEKGKPETNNQDQRAERDLAAQEAMAKWAKWMFWAALGSVVLTAIGVGLIWRTLVHTKLAAIAAADAVSEAKSATEAANQTLAVTENTAMRQLRAYISIEPDTVYNWIHRDQVLGVRFITRNHGQTPGGQIYFEYSMALRDAPPKIRAPELPHRYDQKTALFPGATVPVRLYYRGRLSDDEIADIEAGHTRFHTWGVMHYTDAFKKRRRTKFSFSFGGPEFARRMKGEQVEWSWENGPGHNQAT